MSLIIRGHAESAHNYPLINIARKEIRALSSTLNVNHSVQHDVTVNDIVIDMLRVDICMLIVIP